MLSQGVPMLLAGDEVLHTQRGNNNAYCQDNEIAWFDWTLAERNAEFLRYVRELIRLRRRHRSLRRARFLTGQPGTGQDGLPDIRWHGAIGGAPDWAGGAARCLAFTLAGREDGRARPARHLQHAAAGDYRGVARSRRPGVAPGCGYLARSTR